MNKAIHRWMVSVERVHYTEEDVPSLVNKPLDPSLNRNFSDDSTSSRMSLTALISTKDLPVNPTEGDTYQINDKLWVYSNGKWLVTQTSPT